MRVKNIYYKIHRYCISAIFVINGILKTDFHRYMYGHLKLPILLNFDHAVCNINEKIYISIMKLI